MNTLKNFFRNTSKVLNSEFQRSSEVKHAVSKGQDRELFIKNFLTKSFPRKFVIGRGEILDSNDKRSKQADIVIYDEFMPIFDYGSTKHFLSEGVLSHIEVKSNLTTSELKKALNITKSIKLLKRDINATMHFGNLPKTIFSCIFAYNGLTKEKFKEEILKYYNNQKDIENIVDVVCVLNKYVMVKVFNEKEKKIEIAFFETKEDSLMAFFARLFDGIQKNWAGIPNLYKYLGKLNFKHF